MFTKEQIENAHTQVKSGADFPKYVFEIKQLGVTSHEVVLKNGTWIFKGVDDQLIQFEKGLKDVAIAPQSNQEEFKQVLLNHQKGGTDYQTFCIQAGNAGVQRWISDFNQMTVTYLDSNGNILAVEPIPSV